MFMRRASSSESAVIIRSSPRKRGPRELFLCICVPACAGMSGKWTRLLAAPVLAFALAGAASAQNSGLGKPLTESDIKQWDIAVLPDGTNLPAGSGTAAQGAAIFAQKCSACHGEAAKGGVMPYWPALVGGQPLTNGIDTVKTIANYYAYATTIFDYVRRAMPYNVPRSLTDDEVYALTAYLLAQNKLIGEGDVMDAKTLPQVKMPNRDNFIMPYPDRI
jgi:S-disulfanyl-L-cysteine oxidoreductase SoxD